MAVHLVSPPLEDQLSPGYYSPAQPFASRAALIAYSFPMVIHQTVTLSQQSYQPGIRQKVTLTSTFSNNLPGVATLTSLTIGGRFAIVNGDLASGRYRR